MKFIKDLLAAIGLMFLGAVGITAIYGWYEEERPGKLSEIFDLSLNIKPKTK